jgi:chromosomal replication initiator protein
LTTSDREVVAALGQAIVQRIGEPRYKTWFEKNTKLRWEDGILVVSVPNLFLQEWLQVKFAADVRAAASDVLARPMQVRFAIDPELFRAARRDQEEIRGSRIEDRGSRIEDQGLDGGLQAPPKIRGPEALREDGPPNKPASVDPRSSKPLDPRSSKRPRRWHHLGDFVVGACNRVAHASALSVVEAPGQGPNPLVLHGSVGTGKTHLLEGIYAGLRKNHPNWRVCFVTSEDFTNRFVQAMRLGKLGSFRKHFRECDALLLDDLHFLASKRATQEEFLHTFDALHADLKQVVVTCDCHPRLGDQYTPELTDRLLGGAPWGLTPPDPQTRLDLLRVKSIRDGLVPLPDEVLYFLADQLRGNVRELEGALHCIRHLSRVTSRAIDLCLVREALGDLLRHAVRVVQLADVDRAVCQVLRLEPAALQSKQRSWMVCHPRMLAMFLARKHTTATYAEVGSHFGGRNHSTAVAAEKKVRQWLQEDGVLTLGERPVRIRDLVELVERELLR